MRPLGQERPRQAPPRSHAIIIAHLLPSPWYGTRIVHLAISNQLPEVRRATDMADEFCRRHALIDREANAINVVIDEILSNVIRHGYRDSDHHAISVTLDYADGEITIAVEDDGVPFDPTEVPAPALTGSLRERKIGGLGLVFVRALTDSITYRRTSDHNCLELRRRAPAEAAIAQPSPAFQISDGARGAGQVVTVRGRLDSAAARSLRDHLLNAIGVRSGRFAVDLAGVSYVGSAGIWALLAAESLATARGGGLVVFGLSRDIGQLFARTGVAAVLRICETAAEALAMLDSDPQQ